MKNSNIQKEKAVPAQSTQVKGEQAKSKLDRELTKKLHKILNNLINDPESSEFRKPVYYKALGLEDYKKIIKKPMDLNTVRRNLNKNSYEYLEEVLEDIQLVWNNCKLYNEQGSWIYLTAVKLETFFHDQCLEQFPSIPLPSNKIPDKALLLKEYNEKSKLKQQSQQAKDQMNEDPKNQTTLKLTNQNSNTSEANQNQPQQQQLQQQQTQQQDKSKQQQQSSKPDKQSQQQNQQQQQQQQNQQSSSLTQLPQLQQSQSSQQQENNNNNNIKNNNSSVQKDNIIQNNNINDKSQLPFKFTKNKIKVIQSKPTQHVPFMKFANDKQKFDSLIQTTKAVAKLTTIQQKRVIQIIEEYQPQILTTDEKEVKSVDFHQVSEQTYQLIQMYLNVIKNEELNKESVMDIETSDDDEEEQELNDDDNKGNNINDNKISVQ